MSSCDHTEIEHAFPRPGGPMRSTRVSSETDRRPQPLGERIRGGVSAVWMPLPVHAPHPSNLRLAAANSSSDSTPDSCSRPSCCSFATRSSEPEGVGGGVGIGGGGGGACCCSAYTWLSAARRCARRSTAFDVARAVPEMTAVRATVPSRPGRPARPPRKTMCPPPIEPTGRLRPRRGGSARAARLLRLRRELCPPTSVPTSARRRSRPPKCRGPSRLGRRQDRHR